MPRATLKDKNVPLSERLLDAGEKLIGVHGVQGVSLRQISAAAGTKNNYAVQYHFGDMDGFISAIVARRTPELDFRRATLLAQLKTARRPNTRQLLEVFYQPYFEHVGGENIVARFTLALLASTDGWKPLDDSFSKMMIGQRILEMIAEANPKIPLRIIWQRLRRVSLMILACALDTQKLEKLSKFDLAVLNDTFEMSVAALTTPVGEAEAILVKGAEKYFAR